MLSRTHSFQVTGPSAPAVETKDGGASQFKTGAVAMGCHGDWIPTLSALKYEQVEKRSSRFLYDGLQFTRRGKGLVSALQRKNRRSLRFKRNLRSTDMFIEGRAEICQNPLHVVVICYPNGFCTQFPDA
jgi:hypothetical protein